jgi:hypothetical protein
VPAPKNPDDRQFKIGDKIRVNLHHGKIEDAVVRAVIQDADGIKLQVDGPIVFAFVLRRTK